MYAGFQMFLLSFALYKVELDLDQVVFKFFDKKYTQVLYWKGEGNS